MGTQSYYTVQCYPRPQDSESTASRLICEVNQSAAQLVPRWGTTRESQVLWFFCFAYLVSHFCFTGQVYFCIVCFSQYYQQLLPVYCSCLCSLLLLSTVTNSKPPVTLLSSRLPKSESYSCLLSSLCRLPPGHKFN